MKVFNIQERVALGLQIINGLKIINDNHIIHKDIKPENIIYGHDNIIYFIDFGASRIFDGSKKRDTVLLGTQNYASPEHYGYQETTYKSDMYSLGRVLLDLELANEFSSVIETCLQINPNDRYEDYNQLINEYSSIAKKLYSAPLTNNNLVNKKSNSSEKQNLIKKISNIFGFQKYGYCFDKSIPQTIYTIVIIIFYIFMGIYLFFSEKTYYKMPFIFTGTIILMIFFTCYIVDIIRIIIKKIIRPDTPLLKYLIRALINFTILFIAVVLLSILDTLL